MKILAGMTTNRTHITAKGAPTPFAEKLNKLVVDSLATISKVMKKEFRGFSFGKFRVTYFECDDSGEYLTLYVNGDDTRAQPVIQIRSDEYKRVLRVIPWVYDLEEEDEDYYNKQQGEIKYEDISDIAKSLEYALFNSNVTPFSTSEFKREVGKLAKYLQKEIGSKINSSANLTAGFSNVTKEKVSKVSPRDALEAVYKKLVKWAGCKFEGVNAGFLKNNLIVRLDSVGGDEIQAMYSIHIDRGAVVGRVDARNADTDEMFVCTFSSREVSDTLDLIHAIEFPLTHRFAISSPWFGKLGGMVRHFVALKK